MIIRPGRQGRRAGLGTARAWESSPAARFRPSSVGGGSLIGWWRSDLGITLNGALVSSWADLSGAGHHLVQGNATSQPTYATTGAPNNKPRLVFDGTNDILATTAFTGATPYHLWVVCVWDSIFPVDGNILITAESTTPSSAGRVSVNTAATAVAIYNNTALTTTTASATSWHYWSFGFNAGASFSRQDGVTLASGNAGAGNVINGLTLGSAVANILPAAASVAEILLYSRLLSTSDEARVASYLKTRYTL